MSGPGKITRLWPHTDGAAIRLWNFDVGRHKLKEEHKTELKRSVLPVLAAGGSAHVVGLTSRTGSTLRNKQLSESRADAVVQHLQLLLGGKPNVRRSIGMGEETAAIVGLADGTENPAWRAVTVFYWKRPDPPPRPPTPPPPKLIDVKFYFYGKRTDLVFSLHKWRGELFAIGASNPRVGVGTVYVPVQDRLYDVWVASATGIGTSLEDIPKAFVKNPTPGKFDELLFGPAWVAFPSAAALDRLNSKTIHIGTRGGMLVLRIEHAMPDGSDLHLKLDLAFPRDTKVELSQGIGSLNTRQRLPEDDRRAFEWVLQFVEGV